MQLRNTRNGALLIGALSTLPMLAMWTATVAAAETPEQQRAAMVRLIERDVRATRLELNREQLDPRVVAALLDVPRHEFVPPAERSAAYENRPLPIGHGQTISQPYIVAVMTDLLNLAPNARVLEIGTGSGYQAAILAKLAAAVFSIEIIQPLGEQAAERLQQSHYDNVQVRIGDGYYGWQDQAPFDAIVVTAATSHVPPPLLRQLKRGGRMVIPVGTRFLVQQLVLVEKDQHDQITTHQLLPVRFVPLTGQH
jgi:protein-L-isoaspartate(D-aspartate) O-methyltransferase